LLKTAICDLLGIEFPIIQGGMMWLGSAELAAAVSAAGGLGIIGAGTAEPDWVRGQVRLTRQQTDRPFGVNLVMFSRSIDDTVSIVLEEKVPVVAFGAGNPERFIAKFRDAGIKVISVVASVAAAKLAVKIGTDVIVAEGMESGGEVGEVSTMALVPQVVDAVKAPVVAAGGIADGRGLSAALALGAQGVQMGTRFICSQECNAPLEFKEMILRAGDRATTVSRGKTIPAVRSLENQFTQSLRFLQKQGANEDELTLLRQGKTYLGLVDGDVRRGWLPAGQSAGLIKDIKPAGAIIRDIVAEAETIIRNLQER
jgi:enoyl-[acyl-carrier protein] reductase II